MFAKTLINSTQSLFIAEDTEFGKVIVIKVPYSPNTVFRIKNELFPRKYIKEQKCWVTPVDNIAKTISIFPNAFQSEGFKQEFLIQKDSFFLNKNLKEVEYEINSSPITLLPHQKKDINYLVNKRYAGILNDPGCIDGNAIITIKIDNKIISLSLSDLFIFNTTSTSIIETLSMDKCEELRWNKIKQVLYRGNKQTKELTLDNKYKIKATLDHKFYTDNKKWVALNKLKVGQKIAIKGRGKAGFSTISAITSSGLLEVYDIVMANPMRNFIVNNIIVHNCGKTFSLIYAYKALKEKGIVNKAFVLCPSSLTYNWYKEILKTKAFTATIIEGTKKQKIELLRKANTDFIITNYEAILSYAKKISYFDEEKDEQKDKLKIEQEVISLIKKDNYCLILDESHRIKGRSGKVFGFLRKIIKYFKARYISTGTLIANKPEDAWSQFYCINPAILGTSFYRDFAKKYCLLGNKYSEYAISGYKNLEQLKFIIEQHSIRRLKKDVLDLPGCSFKNYYITMGSKQKKLYEQLAKRALNVLQESNDMRAITSNVFTLIEMASNPQLLDEGFDYETEKLLELDRILDEKINGTNKKVVLWTTFIKNIKLFKDRYKIHKPVVVYGEVSKKDRQKAVDDFQEKENVKLFIGNPEAAGEGLTLTAGTVAIFFDRKYVYTAWEQALCRIHRFSQKESVEIICLINRDTIDEEINNILECKEDLSSYLTNEGVKINNKKERLKRLVTTKAILL